MRRVYNLLLVLCLLMIPSILEAQNTKLQGWCENGNVAVTIPGTQGSGAQKFQRSYPQCTVRVFNAGTVTLSTIYSNSTGTSKANPFTASATGQWFFYALPGVHYDVQLSGGGIPVAFTLGDMVTPNTVINEVINIQDFGAVGDATTTDCLTGTDNTTAINAAFSAARAYTQGIGGIGIYIPPGRYRTTSSINMGGFGNNSIRVFGTGGALNEGTTLLSCSGPGTIGFDFSGNEGGQIDGVNFQGGFGPTVKPDVVLLVAQATAGAGDGGWAGVRGSNVIVRGIRTSGYAKYAGLYFLQSDSSKMFTSSPGVAAADGDAPVSLLLDGQLNTPAGFAANVSIPTWVNLASAFRTLSVNTTGMTQFSSYGNTYSSSGALKAAVLMETITGVAYSSGDSFIVPASGTVPAIYLINSPFIQIYGVREEAMNPFINTESLNNCVITGQVQGGAQPLIQVRATPGSIQNCYIQLYGSGVADFLVKETVARTAFQGNTIRLVANQSLDVSQFSAAGNHIINSTSGTITLPASPGAGNIIETTTQLTMDAPLTIHEATDQNVRISQQSSTTTIQGINDAASVFVPLGIDGNPLQLNSTPGNTTSDVAIGPASTVTSRLFVNDNASTTEASTSGLTVPFHIQSKAATAETLLYDSFATNNSIMMRRADGTVTSPTAVQSGETLGHIGGAGYGTSYTGIRAALDFTTTEIWTGTNQGARATGYGTSNGSTTPNLTFAYDGVGVFANGLTVGNAPATNTANYLSLGTVAVGSLPAAGVTNTGQMITVTNSTAIAAEGQVCAAGGASVTAIAISNGTNWKCF